ncbi:Tim10/DDP family zinc finger-domain-containing protein [Bisporella sp. PMI_857]|nr:Tim10/DDP family zinc finger-domain-containing protein [Bisporella sp. PMI_857]
MDSLGSSDPKERLMEQVKQEAAMTNARQLIEKVNEHCFERCVPKPGASLSSGETTCFTHCMEKYMQAWSTVRQSYLNRMKVEQGKQGGVGGSF